MEGRKGGERVGIWLPLRIYFKINVTIPVTQNSIVILMT
jgi:hypothetical protein